MGRFDYPSPYWDSVGDPALDLIDRMLTVDADQRISIDECLEHPWIINSTTGVSVSDSTDGLTGAMSGLDFSKRKPERERTLLADLNDVQVSKVVEHQASQIPVKVFEKNRDGKGGIGNSQMQPVHSSKAVKTNGIPKEQNVKNSDKEHRPAEDARTDVFMELGGKGDQQLFGDDHASRYQPDQVPVQ